MPNLLDSLVDKLYFAQALYVSFQHFSMNKEPLQIDYLIRNQSRGSQMMLLSVHAAFANRPLVKATQFSRLDTCNHLSASQSFMQVHRYSIQMRNLCDIEAIFG